MSTALDAPPNRPTLSPLCLAALCSWLTTLLVESLAWHAYANDDFQTDASSVFAICLFLVFGIALIFMRVRARRRKTSQGCLRSVASALAIPLFGSVIAFACSFLYWNAWASDIDVFNQTSDSPDGMLLTLTSDPTGHDYGIVSTAELKNGPRAIAFRLLWPEGTAPLSSGHRIRAYGSASLPKADDSGRWNHKNGFAGILKASDIEQLEPTRDLRGLVTPFRDISFGRISSLNEDAAALLAGMLLGNKTLFTGTELQLSFQTTGLAHLMAVSGTHLAIVTLLITMLLGRLPIRRHARNTVVALGLLLYIALTGFAPSAVRAGTMCALTLLLGSFGRRSFALHALAICALLFLSLSPAIAFSLGFQLSVLSVVGIVVFAPLGRSWLARAMPKLPGFLTASLPATIAASTMTLPITIAQFSQLPLVSPLSNLIVAPFVTATLSLGIVAIVLCVFLEPVGMLLLHVAGSSASFCALCVRLLADIPLACLPISSGSILIGIVFAIFLIVLWILWPVPNMSSKRRAHRRQAEKALTMTRPLACTAVCTVPVLMIVMLGLGQHSISLPNGNARIVMLDVGQGDSFLIQSGDATALIDTGEDSDVLIRELAEQGVTHIDAVLVSHKDADHVGALRKIAGIIAVGHVYVHEDLLDQPFEEQVLESARWVTSGLGAEGVTKGGTVTLGEFVLTILGPEHGGESENEDSLVILLEHDADRDGNPEFRGIFSGDAEAEAIRDLVPSIGDIDFLKVAHHGSKGGITEEQLGILRPEVALISVGADNRFGHPTREMLDLLHKSGARIYRTDRQGAVTICFAQQGYSVFTER